MSRRLLPVLLILLVGPWTTGVEAASRPSARTLIRQMRRTLEIQDSVVDMTLTLADRWGAQRVRELRVSRKEDPESRLHRTLIRVEEPAELAGTGLLILEMPPRVPEKEPGEDGKKPVLVEPEGSRPDDQYLYLPALKRIRRIAGPHKQGRFLGSDLAYEDWETREPDRDAHYLLESEPQPAPGDRWDGMDFWVVQSVPKDPDSTYRSMTYWIRTDGSHAPVYARLELREPEGAFREITWDEPERIRRRWIIRGWRIASSHTGSTTLVELTGVNLDQELPDELFSRRSLESGRPRGR